MVYRGGLLLGEKQSSPASLRHFHLDHLGSPRLVTTDLGDVAAYHEYYPFGEEITRMNSTDERLKFTGHERDVLATVDPADDIDYMHARYYLPLVGRFGSPDSVGGAVGSPASWNLYTYVVGNPLKLVDLDGNVVTYGSDRIASAVKVGMNDPEVAATLALYAGDRDLEIKEGDPGADIVTKVALDGEFEGGYDESTLSYAGNLDKFKELWESGIDPTATADLVTSIQATNKATITLRPGGTFRELFHELGHADDYARDPLGYYKRKHPAEAKKYRTRNSRPVEIYAIQYMLGVAKRRKISEAQRKRWGWRGFSQIDPAFSGSGITFP